MKYLFWLIVMVLVWWVYKRARTTGTDQTPPAAPAAAPQDMVTCARCGIHLPHDEAVAGAHGQYCSPAHRSAAGDRNPD